MGVSSYVGSFSVPTGAVNTTLAITDPGFQPSALLFWWVGRTDTADTIGRRTVQRGFGAATSTTDRWAVGSTQTDASATINDGRIHRSDAIVATATAAGAIEALLDISSFDSTGFTVIVDDQFPSAITVHYLALGGSSITNAKAGNFTLDTTTGNKGVTSVGFQPDMLIFASANLTTSPPSVSSSRGHMMIGQAVSSSQRGVWSGGSGAEAAQTINTGVYCTDVECMAFINDNTTSTTFRADFVSMDTNGFTYNILETDAAARIVFYLAIKGGNYAAGSILTQTNTSTQITVSSLSFKPSGLLFISHAQTESTADTMQNHDHLSVGAASSTTQRGAQASLHEDGLTDSEVTAAVEFDEVYINISTASAVQGLMDVQSFDSAGFTCIMDDADPSQAFVLYFAFGPSGTTFNQSVDATEGNAVTLIRLANKIVAVANTPSFTKSALVNKTLAYTAPNTATVIRQASKPISITNGSSVSLSAALVFVKAISATIDNAVNLGRQAGKIVSASASNSISIVKNVAKLIAFTVSNTVSVVRQPAKSIGITESTTVTVTKSAGKIISSSASNSVTVIKQVARSIAATVSNAVSISTQFISGGGTVFNQTVSATVSNAVTLQRSVNKIVAVITIQAVTIIKNTAKSIAFAAISIVTRSNDVSKIVSATGSTALTIRRTISKAFSITSIQSAQISKGLFQVISATVSNNVGITTQTLIGGLQTLYRNTSSIALRIKHTLGSALHITNTQGSSLKAPDNYDGLSIKGPDDDSVEI